MLLWLPARSLWNSVTVGLASASFCRIARRRLVRRQRLGRLAGVDQQDADVVVAVRQVALELGDGGVGVGQLLLDRQRRLVRLQRLGRLAGAAQQDADVVVAVRQVALELGDGGVGVGQLLLDRQRRLVRRQRLGRLAGVAEQDADVVVARRPGRSGTR